MNVWKSISKRNKFRIISITSIVFGLIQIASIFFAEFFILICFPESYQNDYFILVICGFLIMGGLLIFQKKNSFKILYKLFAWGIIADIFAKTVLYGSSFLINGLEIKIPIIIFEINLIYFAFLIARNKDLKFDEDFPPVLSINEEGKILDDTKFWDKLE